MPKVFISWSGEKSHKIAETLYQWIPVVLQSTKPFISSDDLRKGGRWVSELASELEQTNFGILCLTKSNLVSPWLLFEAGALSKFVEDSQVAPFLVGVKPSELPAPLTQFNAVLVDKQDFKRLIKSINDCDETSSVNIDTAYKSVDACWSSIEKELDEINSSVDSEQETQAASSGKSSIVSTFDPILQELILLSRSQLNILNSPEKMLPEEYLRGIIGSRIPEDHPVFDDLEESFRELGRLLQDAGDVIPPSTIRVIQRAMKSSDYIVRRMRRRPPRFRRTWQVPGPEAERFFSSIADQKPAESSDTGDKGSEA